MSAYTARSLYDEENSEEVEVALTSTHQLGEVFNDSPAETIIIAIYNIDDTLQVVNVEKKKINPASSCVLDCLLTPWKEYNLQVHFPGLMGLISPRTVLSAGYGFKIQSGESYHISLLAKKDDKGNKCVLFRTNSLGPEVSLDSVEYKFGDMLLKPSLRFAKGVFKLSNLNLNPNLYKEYRLRQRTQISQSPTKGSAIAASAAAGAAGTGGVELGAIDELEVWGLFFDDVCTIGVSLCQNEFQYQDQTTGLGGGESESDREKEEKKEDAWITVDDIEMQEPFLFIGLPACALFTTIVRSFSDKEGIISLDARPVVLANCPESFKEMFEMLMVTKSCLMEIEMQGETEHLQRNDILWMQQFLLYSSSTEEIRIPEESRPSLERQTQFRHALSHLVGVCIQLTQQPYFKENFMNVLDDISHRVSK